MIVALGVFSVVATIAVGTLLALIGSNERLNADQAVITNLAFTLDSMTREIRTGYNYFCESRANYADGGASNIMADGNDQDAILTTRIQDCPVGRSPATHNLQGVSFFEGGRSLTGATSRRILYFFDRNAGTIMRRIGNGPAQPLVSGGVRIINAEFFVHGSSPQSAGVEQFGNPNQLQPTVTILVHARRDNDPNSKPFFMQTSIVQRTLDI
jgi:type II secretory pathway pseudopilin PulG